MRVPFDADWCIHPGATLQDWMDEQGGMSPRVLATCCKGLTEADVRGVLDGKRRITGPLAAKLAYATHIPASLWLNLERHFRKGLAEGKTWTR